MSKIGVFVSYNHQDKPIADAIVESLTSISSDLDIFIDHSGLEGGDEYEGKIHDYIQRSQWFIIANTGGVAVQKNMDWCFYEVGQFRAKLELNKSGTTLYERMCCLYDAELPGPLSRLQGTRVSTKDKSGRPLNLNSDDVPDYENTELFSFLTTVIKRSADTPLRDVADPTVRKLMRAGVRKMTLAFVNCGGPYDEVVFQPRFSFFLFPSQSGDPVGLTPDTEIDGEDNKNLSTIFGITGRTTTWKEIRKSAISTHNIEPVWVGEMEAAILNIANNRTPIQPSTDCLANDRNFYIPIVARYEAYRSGKKKCYLVFIPPPDRRFSVSMRSSLLLSGLILSIRFRQRIFPIIGDLNAVKQGDTAAAKQMGLLLKLRRELVCIETEAVEFGLPVAKDEHDDPPLLNGFGDEPLKDSLRQDISNWSIFRNDLFSKINEANASRDSQKIAQMANFVTEFFKEMPQINSKFIKAICEELLQVERVEISTAPKLPN